jgi:hypothetical protein
MRFQAGFLRDDGTFVDRDEAMTLYRCVENGKRRIAIRDQVSGRIWSAAGSIHPDLIAEACRDLGLDDCADGAAAAIRRREREVREAAA